MFRPRQHTPESLETARIVLDEVRLGAAGGVDVGTSGTEYFDAFESRRETYIGPEGALADFSASSAACTRSRLPSSVPTTRTLKLRSR